MEHINLTDVLIKEAVVLDHEPFASKEAMFEYMASRFENAGIVRDATAYIKALQDREAQGSTYMGNFIGLPHGKCDEVVQPGIGFCRCKEPFIYCSNGEEGEVKYVFMLAITSAQSAEHYMRVLATLAGMLVHEDFLQVLEQCQTYEELLEEIKKRNENER